jgi:hypothetical protein
VQLLIVKGQVLTLLEGEQTFSLGEFVDGPYHKFPTVKTPKTRRVYDKFHAFFNTNKVPRVVLVFLLAGTHLGIKRESPSHTGQVWPNQQVRPALHPATTRV